jgi:lipoprotein NlpD
MLYLLQACSSSYQAPVGVAAGGTRFLDSGRTHRVNGGETLYAVAWMYDLDFGALARANNLREPYAIAPGQILSVDLRNVPQQSQNTGTVAVATPVVVATGVQRTQLPSAPIVRQTLPGSTPPASPSTAPSVERTLPSTAPAPTPPVTPIPAPTPEPLPSQVAVTPAPAPVVTPPSTPAVDPNAPVVWDWPASGNMIGRFSDASGDNKGIDLAGAEGDPVQAAADGEVVYAGSGLLRYGDLVILKHNERFLSAYAHNSEILVKEGDRVTRGQKIAALGSSGIDRNMLHFEIRLDGKPVDPLSYLPSR